MAARQTRRLTGRDRKILRHLAAFRAADIGVLHQRFFAGRKIEAVRSTLRRLSTGPHHVLRSVPLDGWSSWYQLTPGGARRIGVSDRVCRPLGHHAAARQFALQWFLFLSDNAAVRLIQLHDYPDLFPIKGHRLPQGRFYLSTESPKAIPAADEKSSSHDSETSAESVSADPETKLGYVSVDFGGKPQRIAQRLLKALLRFLKHGWFDDVIRNGQFEVTLLTITASRRRSYEHALPRMLRRSLSIELVPLQRPGTETLPFGLKIYSVPRLREIIFGKGKAS